MLQSHRGGRSLARSSRTHLHLVAVLLPEPARERDPAVVVREAVVVLEELPVLVAPAERRVVERGAVGMIELPAPQRQVPVVLEVLR
jgi:hypothetical protein